LNLSETTLTLKEPPVFTYKKDKSKEKVNKINKKKREIDMERIQYINICI